MGLYVVGEYILAWVLFTGHSKPVEGMLLTSMNCYLKLSTKLLSKETLRSYIEPSLLTIIKISKISAMILMIILISLRC